MAKTAEGVVAKIIWFDQVPDISSWGPLVVLAGPEVIIKLSGKSFELLSAKVPAGENTAASYCPNNPGKSIACQEPLKVHVEPETVTESQLIERSFGPADTLNISGWASIETKKVKTKNPTKNFGRRPRKLFLLIKFVHNSTPVKSHFGFKRYERYVISKRLL
ncbi:MAG: hypothetical protein HY506_02185 [Candidatus Yanofskybacteria bacterium]|nr:hypothetical protein [Candidatus Yanofskybacteria bacterium]